MPLSAAERKRKSRAKMKADARQPGDRTAKLQSTPFYEFYGEDGNDDAFTMPLWLAGMEPPHFADDTGLTLPSILNGLETPKVSSSIERAELIVDCLLDAATGLASIINRYKLAEIARAQASGAVDAKTAERLNAQLKRNARWTLPQWKAKGD